MEKELDGYRIRGRLDDLNILLYNGNKYSSLIEVKTTSKKYLWRRELNAAIRQLQLYLWLYKEVLEYLGYPLWKRHYVEEYSQRNGRLIRRVAVEYYDDIEDWIRLAIRKFQGLERMEVPPESYCKICPKNVKVLCDWYIVMEINRKGLK
jgi:hypothetical protein